MSCNGTGRSPERTVNFGLDGTCKACGKLLALTSNGRIPAHRAEPRAYCAACRRVVAVTLSTPHLARPVETCAECGRCWPVGCAR